MTDTVPIGLIVVRLTQPVKNYPVGTELGYKDVADAIAALGSAHYFEVVRDQQGNPIPPLTPEEIEEAQRAAQRRAKSRRLILGADFDPLWNRVDGIPSAGELDEMRQGVQSAQEDVARLADTVKDIATPVPLPAVPGLYFHLDAQAITATDGSRISTWTDAVNGIEATQADPAKQPQFKINGINGKPGLAFSNSRGDALVTGTLAPTGLTATVFVVMHPVVPSSGSRYVFGTNQSGASVRNLYIASANGLGLQGSPTLTGFLDMNKPRIGTGVFGGASSAVRVDGVQVVTGNTGEATLAPTVFTIGHRHAQTAGNGFEGVIGEVLYYERALTSDECAAVERYLAARWGFSITMQRVWHVDTVFGTASGTGRTESSAMDKISTALTSIHVANAQDATIIIHAPETHPIRETGTYLDFKTGGTIRLQSRTPGEPWHWYGSRRFTAGWTHAGGGVYTRSLSLGLDRDPFCWVPTLLDPWGHPTRIFQRNTATPTTPAAGEYGYSGGTYYLHLPGDANPNEHTVEIATVVNLALITNGTTVTLRDGVIRGAQSGNVSAGSSTSAATVIATDCISEYSTEPWRTAGQVVAFTATRCVGRYASNDGFNHHGLTDGSNRPVMELIDCEGAWNEDEGVSPHENTRLILRGGVYHHNGSSGLTAVQTAEVQVVDTEFHHNQRLNPDLTGLETGGVSMLHQSRLISRNLYSHNHPGPGVRVDTGTGATWTDNGGTRSGTAHGNGAEDQV